MGASHITTQHKKLRNDKRCWQAIDLKVVVIAGTSKTQVARQIEFTVQGNPGQYKILSQLLENLWTQNGRRDMLRLTLTMLVISSAVIVRRSSRQRGHRR